MSISEKQFEALLRELAGIRLALDSFNRSFAEHSVDLHDDLQDLISSVDCICLSESSIREPVNLEDNED